MNKHKKGDIVLYLGRKWCIADDIKGKAYLALLPGEKKLMKGLQVIDSVKTNYKNLKTYEQTN